MVEGIYKPEVNDVVSGRELLVQQWKHLSRMMGELQMYIAQLSSTDREIEALGLKGLQNIIQEIPDSDLPHDLQERSPLEQAELVMRHIQDTAADIERDIEKQ